MRAIMVSVNYSDLLSITLPYNKHHFTDVVVVTTSTDTVTRDVCDANRVRTFCTDIFYARGAAFNKFAALELGLDWMGRDGWLCVMDADVLWPKDGVPPVDSYMFGCLYTPRRRMAPWPPCGTALVSTRIAPEDVPITSTIAFAPKEESWTSYPLHRNEEFAGWTQIFHASDPVLGPGPWHATDWKHAGGADSHFAQRWPAERRVRPPFECLHLGEPGQNWFGRATETVGIPLPEDAAARREMSSRTIWDRRRANRAAGKDQFEGERLGQ